MAANGGADAAAGIAVVESAPAKLNLDLHVTGRRPDGYHELDSLVVFAAGLCDRLVFRRGPGGLTIAVDGLFASALAGEPDNLVLRAARRLAAAAGIARAEAAIGLEKRIPVAAGLGGGSADAAAALRGLNRLWGLGLGRGELARVAVGLGADVAVCLAGEPARMTGIGERLAPVPALPGLPLLLVNPGQPVPTGAVFRGLDRDGAFAPAPPAPPRAAPADVAAFAAWLRGRRNDLEAPARRLAPAIGEALALLAEQPGCLLARMSGSGATCFGLFADADHLAAAADRLRRRRPAWWVHADAVATAASGGAAGR